MAMGLAERIYPHLPVTFQNLACCLQGAREARIRFGDTFQRRFGELLSSERWSHAEIEAYQDEHLHRLAKYVYEHVPYYRSVMTARKLHPDDIRGRSDLPKLPLLTKEDVRRHASLLRSNIAAPGTLIRRHTSGTTGTSLQFYSTAESIAFQWAVWWRHRNRFGLALNDWHANFTGKLVVPTDQNTPPYWRWNPFMHQVLLNMHHITPTKVAPIVEFLEQFPTKFFSGYPSIIHALAVTARDRGISLKHRPSYVVTGAEKLLETQRSDIAEFTGAVFTNQYGLSEGCGNASHCERLTYHEDFEFGIVEPLDPVRNADNSVSARVIMTGFACPEFPLIRYDVGDRAVWESPDKVCSCGRASTVIREIEGRVEDYIITPEGRRIMRFDYCFKDSTNVREAQVVQRCLGVVVLRIVRRPHYSLKDERHLVDQIHHWISPILSVEFEYLDDIPRENGGKFRAVKSEIR